MSKIIPIFVLLIMSFATKAQIVISPDTAKLSCITYGDHDLHLDVINNTGIGTSVKWTVVDIYTPNGWEITQLCDNISCLSPVSLGSSNNSDIIMAGDAMDMKATYRLTSNAVEGVGILTIAIEANASATTAVYMGSTCAPLSLTQFDANSFMAKYINGNLLIVKGHQSAAKSYNVYNAYGQLVESGSLNQITNEISFQHDPSLYIVEVIDEKGNSMGSEKFSNF